MATTTAETGAHVGPSTRVECSLHSISRPSRYLLKQDDGTYHCSTKDPCRTKVVAEPPKPRSDSDPVVEDVEDKPPPVEVCDLCNKDIVKGRSIDEHIKESHGTLLKFCNDLVDRSPLLEAASVHPSQISELGHTIVQLAQRCDPGQAVFNHALDARNQLQAILQMKFPTCKVYMFGSCVATGCWDGQGDVDLTLVDPKAWDNGAWPDDERGVVSKATRTLREAGFHYDELQPLLRTRVPIVKHETEHAIDSDKLKNPFNRMIMYELGSALSQEEAREVEQSFSNCIVKWDRPKRLVVRFPTCAEALKNYMMPFGLILPRNIKYHKKWFRYGYRPSIFSIQFDLSTRAHGVRNSFLLRAYMQQDHKVRCGSVFVKHWSKRSGVNNSMKGYITSYAVTVMWIYFLLVKKQVTFVDPASIKLSLHDKEEVSYLPIVPDRSITAFEHLVGELVTQFFRFYALEFDWRRHTISMSRPGVTTKESLQWVDQKEVRTGMFRDRVWYRFCIEDPFEENLNLARHVSPIKLNKVQMEFLRAYSCLVSNQVDRIMRDRGATASKDTCCRFVHRAMVGQHILQQRDVLDRLREAEEEALAAFEVEHSTTDIVAVAGYELKNQTVTIPHGSEHTLFVPSHAAAMIVKIDQQLEENPFVGVPLSSTTTSCNLNLIYYQDDVTQRYFRRRGDSKKLLEYCRIVKRLHDDPSERATEESIRMYLEDAGMDIDNDVLATALSTMAHKEKASLPPASSHKHQHHVAPVAIRKDASRGRQGKCGECHGTTLVFPTTDPARDGGSYCNRCWEAYV